MEFSRLEYWRGLPFLTPGDFPDPGMEPAPPVAPALQADSLPLGHQVSLMMWVSVQSLSHVQLFETPWTAACRASLSITNSRSLLKLVPFELMMPSNYLILCHPLLFPASIFPSIKVFSSDSVLIRWSNFWSLSFSISPSSEYSGLIFSPLGWTGWISSQSNTTVQKHKFIDVQFS